jgi:hypothetical protein
MLLNFTSHFFDGCFFILKAFVSESILGIRHRAIKAAAVTNFLSGREFQLKMKF